MSKTPFKMNGFSGFGNSPAKHTYYRASNQGGKLVRTETPHEPHGKNRGEPISETNPDTHIGQVNAWETVKEPMDVTGKKDKKLTKELKRIKNE